VGVHVEGETRVWYNEDLESRNFIIPGIIAIIIMIAGAILTSMVVAREYENGTMETIRTLPITAGSSSLGKAIPYFLIGEVCSGGGETVREAHKLMTCGRALRTVPERDACALLLMQTTSSSYPRSI